MKIRRAARAIIDRAAVLTGVLAACERAMRNGLTILTYHRVLPDSRCRDYHLPSLTMPLSAFREQARYLARRFRIVTVGEGVRLLAAGAVDGPPLVSLTFDDGYADNAIIAAPVLAEFGILATFYVTTGLIGHKERLWFDDAALRWASLGEDRLRTALWKTIVHPTDDRQFPTTIGQWMSYLKSLRTEERMRALDQLPAVKQAVADDLDVLMTAEQLKDLARSGHEIGSHSVNHPLLPQLSEADLVTELMLSRQHIALWLNSAPAGFCYPNGDHDERVVGAVKRAGYGYACTTQVGRNGAAQDPLRLLRIEMNPSRVSWNGIHDLLAMRGEISLFHAAMR